MVPSYDNTDRLCEALEKAVSVPPCKRDRMFGGAGWRPSGGIRGGENGSIAGGSGGRKNLMFAVICLSSFHVVSPK